MADHDTHDHTGVPGAGAPTEITDIPTAETVHRPTACTGWSWWSGVVNGWRILMRTCCRG